MLNINDNLLSSCYGIFIAEEYRQKGLFHQLINAAYKLSKEYGCPIMYNEIHYINKRSLIAHIKTGFKLYKYIKYIKFFRNRCFFVCITNLPSMN